jgi:hypothetical protein
MGALIMRSRCIISKVKRRLHNVLANLPQQNYSLLDLQKTL